MTFSLACLSPFKIDLHMQRSLACRGRFKSATGESTRLCPFFFFFLSACLALASAAARVPCRLHTGHACSLYYGFFFSRRGPVRAHYRHEAGCGDTSSSLRPELFVHPECRGTRPTRSDARARKFISTLRPAYR